jgi:hypothetical protein
MKDDKQQKDNFLKKRNDKMTISNLVEVSKKACEKHQWQ